MTRAFQTCESVVPAQDDQRPCRWGIVQFERLERSRHDRDLGFTILEVVIAIGLLAFVMTAIAGVFYNGMRVAVENNLRTQAAGVATRALESMRVSQYSELGFYQDQLTAAGNAGVYANPSRCDTEDTSAETVNLGATAPATAKYVPFEVVRIPESQIDYEVTRCVVWVDAPGVTTASTVANLTDAYKKTSVNVRWTDSGGKEHRLRQESIVYPGGLGEYRGPQTHPSGSTSGFGSCTTNVPSGLTATTPAAPTGYSQINLAWSDTSNPHHYSVQWDNSGSFTTIIGQMNTGDGTARSASVTALASGTNYFFRVISHCDANEVTASAPSNSANASTAVDPATVCTISGLSVVTDSGADPPTSSTKLYKAQSSGRLNTRFSLAVNVTNACSGTFDIRVTGPDPATTVMGTYGLTNSGTVRTGTANVQNETWSEGVYTFTVLRSSVATTQQKTFLVCAYRAPAARSTSDNAC